MLTLALESSCDETAAAIVKDGREVMANIVASQIDLHSRFGGVVPELAARKHVEAINVVVAEALATADTSLSEIEGIVVTRGPGLIGALLVGLSFAKALAVGRHLPLVGVHHIEGHILAPLLERRIKFPFLALAVSGGHTHLYRVDGIGHYQILGRTLDDAAGEAFDKIAKLLGLGYPGGVLIDQLAAQGNPAAIDFPRPMLHRDNLDFSFSGMKTAVRHYVEKEGIPSTNDQLADLAASFQAAVVEVLCHKSRRALHETGLRRMVVAGGVACNSGLRDGMRQLAAELQVEIVFPAPQFCGDNAAMLAVAGDYYLENGQHSPLEINAVANWPLDRLNL